MPTVIIRYLYPGEQVLTQIERHILVCCGKQIAGSLRSELQVKANQQRAGFVSRWICCLQISEPENQIARTKQSEVWRDAGYWAKGREAYIEFRDDHMAALPIDEYQPVTL